MRKQLPEYQLTLFLVVVLCSSLSVFSGSDKRMIKAISTGDHASLARLLKHKRSYRHEACLAMSRESDMESFMMLIAGSDNVRCKWGSYRRYPTFVRTMHDEFVPEFNVWRDRSVPFKHEREKLDAWLTALAKETSGGLSDSVKIGIVRRYGYSPLEAFGDPRNIKLPYVRRKSASAVLEAVRMGWHADYFDLLIANGVDPLEKVGYRISNHEDVSYKSVSTANSVSVTRVTARYVVTGSYLFQVLGAYDEATAVAVSPEQDNLTEIVKGFVSKGVDPGEVDSEGQSLLDLAVRKYGNDAPVVAYLRSLGL